MAKQSPFELMEAYLIEKYDFRYNEVLGRAEYKEKNSPDYIPFEDYKVHSILRELKQSKIDVCKTDLIQLLKSDLSIIYNPFKQYFESLKEKWLPEMPDYIKMITDTIKVSKEEKKAWEKYLKKWLLATVACAINEKDVNQTVLVLIGEQGIGKTKWTEKLVPMQLRNYYFSGEINPGDKDSSINLAECFLINLDELGNLNRGDLASLKQLITQSSVRIRRPYAAIPENMPRRASFVGSVNNSEFLKDDTGNRRFLCLEALKIDYNHDIDIDMVFAQTLYLLDSGEKYWFDGKENAEINLHNQKYKVQHEELEYVYQFFEPCLPNEEADEELMVTELQRYLLAHHENIANLNLRKLGIAMSASPFQRKKKNGYWYYRFKKKKTE